MRISQPWCETEDEITPATMNSAIELARWHFSEARRITGAGIISKELRNAIQLKDWLIDHFLEIKSDHVTASHILNFGPNNLRNAKARDEVLVILKKHGHVNLKEDFRVSNCPSCIGVNRNEPFVFCGKFARVTVPFEDSLLEPP